MTVKVIDLGIELPPKQMILVVDDEPSLQSLVFDTLSSDYRIISAFNGREGIQKAISNTPDLVLMDLMMPVMSGYELRLNQQKDPSLADIPIVCISGTYNAEARAREIEAAACFTKPLQLDALIGTIRAMLASR